jgi:hypothetical protein
MDRAKSVHPIQTYCKCITTPRLLKAILVASFTALSSPRRTVTTLLDELGNIGRSTLVLSSEGALPRSSEQLIRRNLQGVSATAPAETPFLIQSLFGALRRRGTANGAVARRYPPAIAPFAAMSDMSTQSSRHSVR